MILPQCPQRQDWEKLYIWFFKYLSIWLIFKIFIYLAALGFSWGMWDLVPCCSSVPKPCLILCDPVDAGSSVLHYLPVLAQIHIYWILVMLSNHLILSHPLLLPLSFPSIRVFSSELALHIRCPKYWSFSFSISPSNEYSGLISCPKLCIILILSLWRSLK